MINKTSLLLALCLCTTILVAQKPEKKKSKVTGWEYNEPQNAGFEEVAKGGKLPCKIKKEFNDLRFIEGGTFTAGTISSYSPTANDSTLLFKRDPRRITVSSFIMSNHEVTNAEYREFTNWVRDSIARSLLATEYPEYYSDTALKTLNWSIEIKWNEDILKRALFVPASERYYRVREIDSRRLIYKYSNWDKSMETYIAVYPDTLCWTNDFQYAYCEPLASSYFWHPAYDNYPAAKK